MPDTCKTKEMDMRERIIEAMEQAIDDHSGAIYNLFEFGYPRDAIEDAARDVLDAALKVMVEPDEAMLDAGWRRIGAGPATIFPAMLSTIAKETDDAQ